MATQRSLAELLALLPDNVTGRIEPEDLRDLLVSLTPGHGSLSRNAAADTTIVTPGTYVKAAGTTTAGHLDDMTMPVDNRLTFIGVSPRHFHIMACISMTVAGVNKLVGIKIAVNGAVIDGSVVRRFVSTGVDIGAATVQADVTLNENDYVELWVTNETTATVVRLDEFNMHASGTLE